MANIMRLACAGLACGGLATACETVPTDQADFSANDIRECELLVRQTVGPAIGNIISETTAPTCATILVEGEETDDTVRYSLDFPDGFVFCDWKLGLINREGEQDQTEDGTQFFVSVEPEVRLNWSVHTLFTRFTRRIVEYDMTATMVREDRLADARRAGLCQAPPGQPAANGQYTLFNRDTREES